MRVNFERGTSQTYSFDKLIWIQVNKRAGSMILVCLTVGHTIPTRDIWMPSTTITKTSSLMSDTTGKTHAKVDNDACWIIKLFKALGKSQPAIENGRSDIFLSVPARLATVFRLRSIFIWKFSFLSIRSSECTSGEIFFTRIWADILVVLAQADRAIWIFSPLLSSDFFEIASNPERGI